MNKCHFLGKLTHKVEIDYEEGTPYVRFELEIEEFRKDRGGDKKRSVVYLEFEAWDSAALAIQKYSDENNLIAVEAVDRNSEFQEEQTNVYFRVTSFKILS